MTLVEAIKEAIKHAEGVMDENLEMTKEEAKDYIREWCPYDRQEEIIKALEQEPCEDCISRDMALEKMADYVASGYAVSAEDFEEYSRIICQLPPVTQQPKTGHWIYDDEYSDCFDVTYKCSCCKREIIVPYEARNEVYKEYPYCHCGAKMQEVEE